MKSKIKTLKHRRFGRRVAYAAAPVESKRNGPSRAAVVSASPRRARKPAGGAPAQPRPHYDAGLRYDSGLRYVTDDPVPPTGKAKVKLELYGRTDDNLVGFAHSHVEAITGNPSFATPQPTAAVFDAKLAELEGVLAEMENHKVAGKALTERRDAVRAEFELLFAQRGTYVELTSGGDATVIASAGLPVRNPPTPTGILPYPGDLRVDLNGVTGEMLVRWMAVTGAKGYMLEMAEVINDQTGPFSLVYMGGKSSHRLMNMTVGKTYAFRVASAGGADGKSPWSPEVWRAAA